MPGKKHDFTVTEIKAGVFVVAGTAALILFAAAMQGLRPPRPVKEFHVYLADTGGLPRGGDVRFGGAKVGRITGIDISPRDQSMLRLEATVDDDTPVNVESRAFVTAVSLTAEKHLEITTGAPDAPLLRSGDTITAREHGALFDQAGELAAGLTEVLDDVRQLMGVQEARAAREGDAPDFTSLAVLLSGVDRTVGEGGALVRDFRDVVKENRESIAEVFERLRRAEDTATRVLEEIGDIVEKGGPRITGALESVERVGAEVEVLVTDLSAIAVTLQATLESAGGLSGDAQALIAENRPAIEAILLDVRDTLRNLKDFSRIIAEQPEAVIRGRDLRR